LKGKRRADCSRLHSTEFNAKVAEVSDLTASINTAEEFMHSISGTQLSDCLPGAPLHVGSTDFVDDPELQHALAKICSIMESNRPNSAAQAFSTITTAKSFAGLMALQLKDNEEADRKAHSMSKGFGLWRHKQLKMYLRHVVSRSVNRKPSFLVEPAVYLQSVTGKVLPVDFPAPAGDYHAATPTMSPMSVRALQAPRTLAEVESLLMKAREASAPSPLRQISYKMWQMLLPQHCKGQIRTRRKRLIQTWKMNPFTPDEGSPDQFMFSEIGSGSLPDVQVFRVKDEFGEIESSSDEDDAE
jgi:hypothetical protein